MLLTLFLIPPFSYFLVHGLIPRHLFLKGELSPSSVARLRLCSVTLSFFLIFLGNGIRYYSLGWLRWNKTGLFILFSYGPRCMIIRQRTSEIFKIVDLIFDLVQICPSFPPRECQHSYLIIPIVALKSQANLAIICLVIHNPKQKNR